MTVCKEKIYIIRKQLEPYYYASMTGIKSKHFKL